MNSIHSIFLVVTSAFLLTSVAVAKPAFPSKIPYQGFSCSTCHDGSPGLASMNDFADDFKAAGNMWTQDLCEKDSDGDGASNGVELLDPDCDWMEGDRPRSGNDAYKPSDASSKPEIEEPEGEDMTPAPPAGGVPVSGGATSALPTTPSGGPAASSGPAPSPTAGAPATPANAAMGGAASASDDGGDSGGCSVSLTGGTDPLAILGLGAFVLLAMNRRRR